MCIGSILLDRVMAIAAESGYMKSGHILKDAQLEIILVRFAGNIEKELILASSKNEDSEGEVSYE